jgi:hypothetical protein
MTMVMDGIMILALALTLLFGLELFLLVMSAIEFTQILTIAYGNNCESIR